MVKVYYGFEIAIVILSIYFTSSDAAERSFKIDYDNNCFTKDGHPFRYISGGIHYFRVPRFYWQDRLSKVRASGANAIQTYIAWNLHEPVKGRYNFEDELDIVEFIKLAAANDLLVIIRAGPFICAEWDFGGLPSWLLKNRSIAVRTSKSEVYLQAIDDWLTVLLGKLKPFLYENNGPIISLQVENEYGSYSACDGQYMSFLEKKFRAVLGDNVVLFTTDGYDDRELKCGGTSTLYKTVDFGASDPTEPFKQQRKYEPKGPLVNSEYYTGWLDQWGQPHQTRDAKQIATYLDKILSMNASVNMYMFEGGTNFGFMNGAINGSKYSPVPTSYDYDAPLSEAGDPTEKYDAIKAVIAKYTNQPVQKTPAATKKTAYGKMPVTTYTSMYVILENMFKHGPSLETTYPMSMEEMNHSYGFVMYRANLDQFSTDGKMTLDVGIVRDRAVVLMDQAVQGYVNRNGPSTLILKTGNVVDILVENQGRINDGYMNDPKGLLTNVTLDGRIIRSWKVYLFPAQSHSFHSLANLPRQTPQSVVFVPSYVFIEFYIGDATDTYLKLDGWGKGVAYINQFNLGRYWQTAGPQKTLYVPRSILHANQINNVILFELDQSPCLALSKNCYIEFVDAPVWG